MSAWRSRFAERLRAEANAAEAEADPQSGSFLRILADEVNQGKAPAEALAEADRRSRVTDPFSLLNELFVEQRDRLNAWLEENPDADQSPDYQADLSRLERLLAAIQQAEGAAS